MADEFRLIEIRMCVNFALCLVCVQILTFDEPLQIIGFVMFVSGAVAVAIEYVENKADSIFIGGLVGLTIR